MKLSILYRGPLSSCNYGCDYCPFAKHHETYAEHEADRKALQRFVDWIDSRNTDHISVLFTPWGEALVRKRYQNAITHLTQQPQVDKVAIQTNLSCRLEWVENCDKNKLALWTTFHPTQISRERFLARCLELDQRGVRFSVGMVGMKEHREEIAAMRRALPPHIYLWINAYKQRRHYYTSEELQQFTAIDPLFRVNTRNYRSVGQACQAGQSVISVDGDGTMRRCHFIKTPIGNIYEPDFEQSLYARTCTNRTCNCHIGYVHMPELNLYDVFGSGILERIPRRDIPLPMLAQMFPEQK